MGEYVKSISKALNSSEMATSLRYENVHGRPYNLFTARGITVLSLTTSLLAMVSLLVAA